MIIRRRPTHLQVDTRGLCRLPDQMDETILETVRQDDTQVSPFQTEITLAQRAGDWATWT